MGHPRYDNEAIEQCLRLYLKYSGQQHKRIEQEMQKTWPGWSAKNLHTRGRGPKARMGWIEKYGFARALEIHLAQRPTAALNSAQQLVIEIETIRRLQYEQIKGQGANVEKEKLQLHRDYCKLHIEALTRVEAAKDTLGSFVSNWERLVDWAVDIDVRFARLLVKHSDAIRARAEQEFGETVETIESMNGDANSADAATDSGAEA